MKILAKEMSYLDDDDEDLEKRKMNSFLLSLCQSCGGGELCSS